MSALTCDRRTTKWQAQRSAAPNSFFILHLCLLFLSRFNAAAGIYEMASDNTRSLTALLKPFINPVTLFWPNAAECFSLSQGERAGVRAGVLLT